MPLTFCCIAKKGRVTLLKDWYGAKVENNISLLELFNAFAAGELDELHQPLDEDEFGGGKVLTVAVGKSKDDLTTVSKSATVLDISPNNYVRFVLSDLSKNSNMVGSLKGDSRKSQTFYEGCCTQKPWMSLQSIGPNGQKCWCGYSM